MAFYHLIKTAIQSSIPANKIKISIAYFSNQFVLKYLN